MSTTTRYAIIGSGRIGTSLARLFSRAGIKAGIANTRGPQSLRDLAATIGPHIQPMSMTDALSSDVIFLAIPFPAVEQVGSLLPNWTGKTMIDATNAHGSEDVLKGRASAHHTAEKFPGATVVKAFNQLPADVLAAELNPGIGKRVVFIATDVSEAGDRIAELARELGLAAVQVGAIDEGGRLIEVPGPLVLRNLIERPL